MRPVGFGIESEKENCYWVRTVNPDSIEALGIETFVKNIVDGEGFLLDIHTLVLKRKKIVMTRSEDKATSRRQSAYFVA